MAINSWQVGARQISNLMRYDTIRLYKSVPTQDEVGEWADSLVFLGEYRANVTTPAESIDEDVSGTLRTHNYEITLDVDVPLPRDAKLFVELVSVRQGDVGAIVEVNTINSGLLGQTLSAADERY